MKRKKGVFRSAARAVALAAALAATAAHAHWYYPSEIIDGVEWAYYEDWKTGMATLMEVSDNAAGYVTVPDTLGGRPVTSIGSTSFYECKLITDVEFPPTVTNIGSAFLRCTALTNVVIPSSVREIDSNPFDGCSSLAEVHIAEDSPYFTARGGIIYSKDMTRLVNALQGADLGDCVIPSTVTNIGIWAFARNTRLRSVSVPGGVRQIGLYTFGFCPALEKVTLSQGIETIEKGVFANSIITNLALPASLRYFSPEAVSQCTNLLSFSVANGSASYAAADGVLFSRDRKTLVRFPTGRSGAWAIPSGTTAVGDWAFFTCKGLTALTVPEGVENAGFSAFRSCPALTSVSLPGSLGYIGGWAFCDDTSLEELILPEGLAWIGERVFSWCKALKRLTVPDSLAGWDSGVDNCPALEWVEMPGAWDGTDKPGDFGISDWKWTLRVYRAPADGTLWKYAVQNGDAWVVEVDSAATALEMPATLNGRPVAGVTNNAFAACTALRRLEVPASWEDTPALAGAGIPAGCEIVYVGSAPQTLEWTPPAAGLPGERVTLAATASGGGAVEFAVVSGPAVLEGDILTFTGPGTATLRARQAGSVRWEPVEGTAAVEIAATDTAGRRVHADLAANYADGWNDGGNRGSGFGNWSLAVAQGSGNGWSGCGIWDPSANGFAGTWAAKTRAFGLVGKGSGWSVRASRPFARALRRGDAFSLEMALNWDSNRDGAEKGFALVAGGKDIVTVNHGSYPGNIFLNGDGSHDALNAFGVHPMVWTFTAADEKTLRVEATRRDGGGGVFATDLAVATSAIDGFRLQSANQNPEDSGSDGDKRQSYFDDFRLFLGEDPPATSSGVPHAWLDRCAADIVAACGGDYEAAAAATAPNGRTVADCWVIGLEDLSGDFTVSVVFADGEPRVVWNPDLNEGGTKDGRIYRLWGRETLPAGGDDAWTDVTDDPAPAGREFRFFRATVALPE